MKATKRGKTASVGEPHPFAGYSLSLLSNFWCAVHDVLAVFNYYIKTRDYSDGKLIYLLVFSHLA